MTTLAKKTWNIERADLLDRLGEESWSLFRQEGTTLTLKKGDCVYPDHEDESCVYVVTQGFCKLMTLNDEGKRFSISILRVGDFAGNVLVDTKQSDTAADREQEEFLEAFSGCQLLRIASQRFADVMEANPKLYISVLQNLQGKTRSFQRKLSDLLFKDVHARIAQLFLELLFEYGEDCEYAIGLRRDLCLRHHEIAELIGASRPVTSLALGDFLKADLIHKHNGFICLQDLERMKRVAEGGVKVVIALKATCSPRVLAT